MAVRRRLHLYRSLLLKRLSSPKLISNRLRGAIREGLWSSSDVPGAGILMRVEPYWEAGQSNRGVENVGTADPQNKPAWSCWSPVRPLRATKGTPPLRKEVPPQTVLGFVRLKHGAGPATRPLSYRQLNAIHGRFLNG